MQPQTISGRDPWVVVAPHGLVWSGHAVDEERAWAYATNSFEPRALPVVYKAKGWYAARATLSWQPSEPAVNLFATPEVDLFK